MQQRIGSCSLCGGSVMGHAGPWFSVNPPPPATCAQCGATDGSDVIRMHPRRYPTESPYDAGVWRHGNYT